MERAFHVMFLLLTPLLPEHFYSHMLLKNLLDLQMLLFPRREFLDIKGLLWALRADIGMLRGACVNTHSEWKLNG